jgi:DNA-binding response OmpR family regulator
LEELVLSDPLSAIGIFTLGAATGSIIDYARHRHVINDCRKALHLSAALYPNRSAIRIAGLKALLVCRDPEMMAIFSHLLSEKRIESEECSLETAAIEKLSSEKYDAVVLDFEHLAGCAKILNNLPRPNQNALVIALAPRSGVKEIASQIGAGFIIERPLVPTQIRSLLNAAYGRILRDRQAYFRLAVELPVWIRRESGNVLECFTVNLSQRGMSVKTPSPFQIGEQISIGFAIPNADVYVSAEGKIIWDDKHGKAGISFQCTSHSAEKRFFEWLHDQFFMALGSETREGESVQNVPMEPAFLNQQPESSLAASEQTTTC